MSDIDNEIKRRHAIQDKCAQYIIDVYTKASKADIAKDLVTSGGLLKKSTILNLHSVDTYHKMGCNLYEDGLSAQRYKVEQTLVTHWASLGIKNVQMTFDQYGFFDRDGRYCAKPLSGIIVSREERKEGVNIGSSSTDDPMTSLVCATNGKHK